MLSCCWWQILTPSSECCGWIRDTSGHKTLLSNFSEPLWTAACPQLTGVAENVDFCCWCSSDLCAFSDIILHSSVVTSGYFSFCTIWDQSAQDHLTSDINKKLLFFCLWTFHCKHEILLSVKTPVDQQFADYSNQAAWLVFSLSFINPLHLVQLPKCTESLPCDWLSHY